MSRTSYCGFWLQKLRFAAAAVPAGAAAVALIGAGAGFDLFDRAKADPARAKGPVEISGNYAISFNGFGIGEVRTESRVAGKSYVASSDVEISALLGAFRWKGVTRSAGTIDTKTIQPSGYAFEFSGTGRSGLVRMGFANGAVTQLTSQPQTATPPDFVPLQAAHLKSVVDPLSALVAISQPSDKGPCGKKLALFDGKQRFDVTLVGLRRERLTSNATGETFEGLVCRVKYTPLGGYRANAETAALAGDSGIEVTFRPVPNAGFWVPYRVALPTLAGHVTIEAARIDIQSGGGAQIALVD